jgi:hypothetical protein
MTAIAVRVRTIIAIVFLVLRRLFAALQKTSMNGYYVRVAKMLPISIRVKHTITSIGLWRGLRGMLDLLRFTL